MKNPSIKKSSFRIQVIGQITTEAYGAFSEAMLTPEAKKQPVLIELNSPGGDAIAALAFAARIRRSPSQVTIVVYGEACSAAVIILAYGHRRLMTKEAWVMVHEDSGKVKGSVVELEVQVTQARRLEYQWIDLLETITGTSSETWEKLHKATTYLDSKQCKELGLIDEVV